MDTIIWTIGWPVAVDLRYFLTVKTQILRGEDPRGITGEAKGGTGLLWLLGILLTMIY